MGNHTATPWHNGAEGFNDRVIYRSDGYAVADAKVFHGKIDREEAVSNAEFILKACNGYEGMRSALQGALDSLTQNKTFPADIEHAKKRLIEGLQASGAGFRVTVEDYS